MLAQMTTFGVQMVSTVVLARLLIPADFGVVTMVTTFSGLLASCAQVGFPDAVLQREEMNHFLASNLFWINLSVALLLMTAFAAAAPLLARFYGDPRVARITVAVSLSIFITSTSVLHSALLRRAMRFSAVSANDIVARLASVAVSVTLAFLGWGYWALVAGVITQPLATSVGVWILCRWVPGLPRRAEGTAAIVRFARDVAGNYSVGYFTHNVDNLLVGWRFGPGPLGFYKKAYDLFSLPFSLLTVYSVAVSTLSRLNRDINQYKRYFLGGLSILAMIGMGLGATLTLVGKDLVRLILGPRWGMAGYIFTFFGPGIGVMLTYGTYGMIHLSLGTTARYFRWGLIEAAVTCLMFLVGLPWGPVGIAIAWTASYWVLTIPALLYAGKPIQLGVAPILGAVWKYLLSSLLAGCACAAIIREIRPLATAPGAAGALLRIATTSLLFAALYLGAVMVLHRGCAPLYQLGRLLREMSPWSRFSKPSPAVQTSADKDASVLLAPTAGGGST